MESEIWADSCIRFTEMSKAILGDNLIGIYLHGSAAMGCFQSLKSDLDLILVVEDQIPRQTKLEFMRALVNLKGEAPAKGFELSIVKKEVCHPFVYPTPFELHFSVSHLNWFQENPEDYVDKMNGTDKDLAAHVMITNHYGVVLYGTPIKDMFGEVCRDDYIDSIWNDINHAENDILLQPVYVSLNLCRVLAYLKENLILSKKSGGEWGVRSVPDEYSGLIQRALACYESDQDMEIDPELAVTYAAYMLKEIARFRQAAEYRGFFQDISEYLKLGEPAAQPYRVTGGYLHKMFKLETTSGSYAVKLLNPFIMKRPGAIENYKRAEHIEQILCDNGIPVVPAMEVNGSKLHCLDKQYFYVFQWVAAKALGWHEIREDHCRVTGTLLAKIHRIQLQEHSGSITKFDVDWDRYINLAKESHSELAEELSWNRELLYSAQREYNAAIDCVPDIVCISDGDMDCKNVLWENGNPLIIDLECLDYGNPCLEMFQLALSWAGGAVCSIDFACLNGFIAAYLSEYGEMAVDWKSLSGAGFDWLDWLEYNTKRALWIECKDEEEQKLGIREAHETIRRIAYYASVRRELTEYIRENIK